MKVLYLSKALVVAAYRDKIRELARDIAVTAVIPERWGHATIETSPPGVPEPRRVPVRMAGHNHLHFYPGAGEWLDEIDPDLVHIDEEPYSLVTLQLARLCGRRGIPFVFFAWQNLVRRLPPPFTRIRASVFRYAAGGIAGTDGAAAVLRRAGFCGRIGVVPQFGVDVDRFRPDECHRDTTRRELAIPANAFVVGYGGRVVREKGVRVLLDAFARLARSDPASHLIVIGDGPESGVLQERARTLGCIDRVHFIGHIDSAAMPAVLPALDVLVLPTIGTRTWTEQFGRILIEAMACGVPVAGSRCGEIPNVIGDAGDLFPVGDAAALHAILESHRRHPELRRARAECGRERVLAGFTQRSIAGRTIAFYNTLLEPAGFAV